MRIVTLLCFVSMTSLPAFGTEACAHRGDVAAAPENTVPAFISAVKKGAGMIEFDVQLSKDGRLVIMHDATVNRTTDGKGRVSDLTFDELRALDAGSWFDPSFAGTRIPTLEETLNAIPKTIQCNVHLKNSPGVAAAVAAVLEKTGRLEHCFLACTIEQAREARKVVPTIRICNMSRQGGNRKAYVELTIEESCDFIQLHQRNGLEQIDGFVKLLRGKNVLVNYFGSEDPEMISKLAKAGVDYILTDNLDLCLKVLQRTTSHR